MQKAFWSAIHLARELRAKKIGALELFELYGARIEQHDRKLNAICVLDLEAGRRQAKAADRARGRRGALHGLPMTVKESFDVAGFPTTHGLVEYRSNVARRDSVAVARLRAAGANVFGKTNVPVHLADWQTFNPLYGTTNNPWDLTRTPGGSSGGSAAALAAGLTGLELGSDIGASIRGPAHYCGVYGHKPTWGICAMNGHALPNWVHPGDITAIGPLARSARDLRLALGIIGGPDEIDGAGWQLRLARHARRSFRGLRVAVMPSHAGAEVDASVSGPIQNLADFLAGKGAKVSDRARPEVDPDEAHRVYLALLRGATAAKQTEEQMKRWQQIAGMRSADDMSYEAQAARGNTLSHRDWLKWSNRRHQLRHAWADFFRDWDLLLCPPAASAAFPQNQKGDRWERMISVNGKAQPSTTQLFWAGYSGVALLPSSVAPLACTAEGLPVGVQIVGAQYADYRTIGFAELLEREVRAFEPPPGYD